ncbi:FtsK/SpoIIIE family DNA translocase [Haloimpatiens massiliensis]|uniref:FtsK/SpoIIIE family DNA translocase n=1 Tax=Haloimpatiens massiliensis TaxID=1658110 RepID=UPI000C852F59|nr:DNA translocase FtsK [Haloimpatiens massiliensis]
MGKKRSRTKKSVNRHNEIKGLGLVTFGLLSIFSIYMTKSSGIFGGFIKSTFILFCGIGTYVLPFLIIFLGIMYIYSGGKIKVNSKFYGIILFFINTLLFVGMLTIDNYYSVGYMLEGIKKIWNSSSALHGGVIAYIIDVQLYRLFGKIGSYIIFLCIYIISSIIILNLSLSNIIYNIKANLKEMKKNSDEYSNKDIRESATAEYTEPKLLKDKNDKIKIIDFLKNGFQDEENNEQNKEENKSAPYVEDCNENINDQLSREIQKSSSLSEEINYTYPSTELLNINDLSKMKKGDKRDLINSANKLEETLSSFGVEAKVLQVTKGPSVTRYELQPEAGVKVSKIVNLSDDIALSLAASAVRIEAPIPGKSAVGIEIPNKELTSVYIREVIESEEFIGSNKSVTFCLGKDISGKCVVADLSKMPHLLVAGATGSGKSVCINTLIISLLYKYSPKDVKLLLIDPKVVELSIYNGIPHLLIPVVTDPKKSAGALNWAVNEMTRRYKLFADNSVRNIDGYNELYSKNIVDEKLPFIVIIIDELADLMMVCPGEVEEYIGRLAQMARAAGMHLVIATQRPSVDVITGVIKANIPSRISFAVSSQIDSRTILDSSGAEKLLGKGDMLFYPVGESKPIRIQGAFISEEEVENVVQFIKDKHEDIDYKEEIIEQINSSVSKKNNDEDELLDTAIDIVVQEGQASTSLLQRKLKIGYNRAARIIEQLEDKGIISGRNGSKPRQVLLDRENE